MHVSEKDPSKTSTPARVTALGTAARANHTNEDNKYYYFYRFRFHGISGSDQCFSDLKIVVISSWCHRKNASGVY